MGHNIQAATVLQHAMVELFTEAEEHCQVSVWDIVKVEAKVVEVVEEGCQVSVWAHLCSGRQPTVYYSQQAHTSPPDTLTVRQSWDNKVRGAGGGGQGGGPQGVHKVGKGGKETSSFFNILFSQLTFTAK